MNVPTPQADTKNTSWRNILDFRCGYDLLVLRDGVVVVVITAVVGLVVVVVPERDSGSAVANDQLLLEVSPTESAFTM